MARTVKDAAYILQAIAGKDPHDNYTCAIPYDPLPDYISACKLSGLKGKRIGVPRNSVPGLDIPYPISAAFNESIKVIEKAGAEIVDNLYVDQQALESVFNGPSILGVLASDFLSDLPKYLSQLTLNPNNVHTLADVSNFTHRFPPEDYPDRDTSTWDGTLAEGFENTNPKFWPLYQENLAVAGPLGILGLLSNFSLDALILPTLISSSLPALGGLPVVTVPLGFYPANTTVVRNDRGTLVETWPNKP